MIQWDDRGLPEAFLAAAVVILLIMLGTWTLSTEWAILLSVAVALFTSTATARLSAQTSQRAHTVTMLLTARTDSTIHGHISTMIKTFKTKPISTEDLSEKDKKEGIHAVEQLLNFYEFFAKSIENKDLDENLVRESIENQFITTCNFCRVLIGHAWENDTRNPKKSYSGILWLYKRWSNSELFSENG